MEDNLKRIKPALRTELVQEYYFAGKLKEVDNLRKSGKDIINLGIGSPDLPPSNETLDTLCSESLKSGNHGYQSYYGIPELRKAFSDWYSNYFSVNLNPDNEILPLIGSKEGIMHITMAFVNPGERVLVPNPGYPTYSSVTKLAGGVVTNYDLSCDNNWLPDFDAIEKNGLENVKLMWVNYPHMPTGAPATINLFEKLVEFGRKHGILICNDNPYSFILNENRLSILSVDGAKDFTIELNSLSKSHNMPGWRVGMVAGKSEYISAILKVKSNMDSGMFRPLQLAAAKALSCDSEWYSNVNKVYKARRVKAESIMESLGCTFEKNQQGLFLWGKVPSRYKSGEELADKLLYNADIFVTPGKVFGSGGLDFIRISLCATEDKLDEALKRINKII